jgi:hypothetical protein
MKQEKVSRRTWDRMRWMFMGGIIGALLMTSLFYIYRSSNNDSASTTNQPSPNAFKAISLDDLEEQYNTVCPTVNKTSTDSRNPGDEVFISALWIAYDQDGVIQKFICLPYNDVKPITPIEYEKEGLKMDLPQPATSYRWERWAYERKLYVTVGVGG